MKKIKIIKKMKTFKWNLRNWKREKMNEIEETNDWDEKDVEAEKEGENENYFHEEVSMNHELQ
ncbi:MAG: hypothetical protein ACXACO_05765 [Promethearchaeota archaeon]|jgi:hypothetical protein